MNFPFQEANNQPRSTAQQQQSTAAATSPSSTTPPAPPGVATAAARPKSVTQWSVVDVQKWFRKTCGEYYADYAERLLEQDITGRFARDDADSIHRDPGWRRFNCIKKPLESTILYR